MLTRKQALARLRATGTLNSAPRAGVLITNEQANTQLARTLNTITAINITERQARQPWLAPSQAQSVLP